MTRILIIDPDGQVVGRIIEETRGLEAITEPLQERRADETEATRK